MHGSVYRQNKKINNFIGTLAVLLYGFFSYRQLLKKHWLHHHPASEGDPDYHDGNTSNVISWYFQFMKEYWSWTQFIGMTIAYNLAKYVLLISETNLLLFWIFPAILSSIQLFYFGTFCPIENPNKATFVPIALKRFHYQFFGHSSVATTLATTKNITSILMYLGGNFQLFINKEYHCDR